MSAEWQFALREQGIGRVLMSRLCNPDGTDYQGFEAPWRDIATFGRYNDADMVLRKLRGASPEGKP